jgi:disease resistance protein RPM1
MEAVGASDATIKSLLTKLGSLLAEEYALIRGVRGDIQFINDELASMQAFLSNLSNSGDDHDDQTKDWMKQVRDVSYDIEDCVDDFAHGIRPDPRGNGLWSMIRRTVYAIQTCSLRRSVASQISDLKERAKNVGERRGRYGVRDPENVKKKSILAGSSGYLAAENQETTRRLISIKKPVGVKDIEKLEKWISSEGNKTKLGVLSIVGFGGVGKTTIALALYRKYGDQFQHRAVVTVSQNSDPEAILGNVLSQVKPQANSEELQAGYGAGTIPEKANHTSLLGSIWSRIISPTGKKEEDAGKNEGLQEELKSYLKNRYDQPVLSCFTIQFCASGNHFQLIESETAVL